MGDKFRVTVDSLNVRAEPDITARVVAGLRRNQEVEKLEVSADLYWFKIKAVGGVTGWSAHRFLQQVIPDSGDDYPWMPIARAELGVEEFAGSPDNPRIVEYLQTTSLGDDLATQNETAWCSAFMNWCVEKSGYEGTGSAGAKSWRNWGREIDQPVIGCIAVFDRPPVVAEGHVGFYLSETPTKIQILSGNFGDAVTEDPYEKDLLIGYRLPATLVSASGAPMPLTDPEDSGRFLQEPNSQVVFTDGVSKRIIESPDELADAATKFAPRLIQPNGAVTVEQVPAGFLAGIPGG